MIIDMNKLSDKITYNYKLIKKILCKIKYVT